MKKFVAASALFLLPLCALEADSDLSGTYNIVSYDALFDANYEGVVQVVRNGEIYAISWSFQDHEGTTFLSVGSGLLNNNVLSITFQDLDPSSTIGTESLKVTHHGEHLSGPWSYFGDLNVGRETWRKVCD